MNRNSQNPANAEVPIWRNPTYRMIFYQVMMLVGLLGCALYIYRNTLINLTHRGINTGFSFLLNEAGFGIGEITRFPEINLGFILFISSVIAGLLAVFLLSRWLKTRNRALGDDYRWLLVAFFLLLAVPGLTLYLASDSITTYSYSHSSNYILALLTGLANTLKVAVLGCVLSTILGLFIALARLSPNFLLKKLSIFYIEINRNIPVLMQLFFWYFIVFQQLPGVRQSFNFFDLFFLNNRGLFYPERVPTTSYPIFLTAIVLCLVGAYFIFRYARRVQEETGRQIPKVAFSLLLLVAGPGLVWLLFGSPYDFNLPSLQGFNFKGGESLSPEFMALVTGLTVYISAFNAEIIRSGIESVSKGQREAARALALKESNMMRLVILPQSLRVSIPPMTSEYLAIAKNSSLAVAVGYPELVSVGGTILNQTGQSIEIIGIWMAVYLTISLSISIGMNWYNAKIKLVER